MTVITQTEPNDNYVEVRLSERISTKDYEKFLPVIDAQIERCGRICLLVIMEKFQGWDVETGWEETKFMFSRFNKIDRVGIVGASELQKWMSFLAKPFNSAEVKYFAPDEEETARKWVSDAATKYVHKKVDKYNEDEKEEEYSQYHDSYEESEHELSDKRETVEV